MGYDNESLTWHVVIGSLSLSRLLRYLSLVFSALLIFSGKCRLKFWYLNHEVRAGVTVEEVRSASPVSDPPPLYPPVLTTPISLPTPEAIGYPSAQQVMSFKGKPTDKRQLLDEIEIRELRIDHIDHRCCWGSRPARTWKIRAVVCS
ncbi:uncharacterized protein LOC130499121 [Raphanus sativus]|uniref:Uncharacterized protein LOC130499121 n=1 Tax=Raphanus sativus TaxID=3726 RepID=A0A9W3CC53_RAPSA|nr:uncharacterized protein LOC130499121 [Raphanus sativus]